MIKIIAAGLKYAGQYLAVGSVREFPPEIEAQYTATGKAVSWDFALVHDDVVTATRNANGDVVGLSAGGKRVGSVCLLHYENAGGFIALPASGEQIVGSVVLIPANTLKPGDTLRFVCYAEDAGTADAATRSVRVRIHTADSVIPGVVLTSVAISSASNSKFMVDKPAVIISNTASRAIPSGFGSGLITTNAITTSAIDCTVDQYIGLTIQNSNTLVNHLIYFASLTLEQAQ